MTRELTMASAIQRASRVVVNASASGGEAITSELNALDVSCRRWLDSRQGRHERRGSEASRADNSWLGTGNLLSHGERQAAQSTDGDGSHSPTSS
jgi:hypothetical protein